MRAKTKGRARGSIVAVGLACTACSLSAGPSDYLDTPQEVLTGAHGAWAEARVRGGATIKGELIALSADSVWILEEIREGDGVDPGSPGARTSNGLAALSMESVREVTLVTHRSGASAVTLWTVVGTVSTVSHGAGLVLSAPVWVLVGAVNSHGERNSAVRRITPADWPSLRPFARFPLGIPPGTDRSALRPKRRVG